MLSFSRLYASINLLQLLVLVHHREIKPHRRLLILLALPTFLAVLTVLAFLGVPLLGELRDLGYLRHIGHLNLVPKGVVLLHINRGIRSHAIPTSLTTVIAVVMTVVATGVH